MAHQSCLTSHGSLVMAPPCLTSHLTVSSLDFSFAAYADHGAKGVEQLQGALEGDDSGHRCQHIERGGLRTGWTHITSCWPSMITCTCSKKACIPWYRVDDLVLDSAFLAGQLAV